MVRGEQNHKGEKMTSPDNDRLNPSIKEVKIGIRRLRKIKIYPLSASDQFKMTDMINAGLQAFAGSQDLNNVEFVATLVTLVQENIGKIIELITDEKDRGDHILDELTNAQIVEIADIIYEVNYETIQKKVTSLLGMLTETLPTGRLSQQFSEDIPNIDLETSTQSDSEMED
jgi:hypothetical protein